MSGKANNEEQDSNIEDIFVTFSVFQLEISGKTFKEIL